MCRTGCLSQDHETYGACCRAASIQIDKHALKHGDVDRRKDQQIHAYQAARKQGIQPESWRPDHVQYALDQSDRTGKPFQSRV